MVKIAVEGCCHGELELIYSSVLQQEPGTELLLICGDFQCVRDNVDLDCVAVPQKYRRLNTFHQYVLGEKVAPILTVFIGGNHEASNILLTNYYGGFVAPNIYFLGFAGSVVFKGIKIRGISGIYNDYHFRKGHFEKPPFNDSTLRSIYHMREIEIFRLSQLEINATQIFLSHDWPSGIWDFGSVSYLLSKKPFFKEDIDNGRLGNPPLMKLLHHLKPAHWFSAHLHVKFQAAVSHDDGHRTQFMALDKALPGRQFFHILDIPAPQEGERRLQFDPEWLAVLRKTHHLLQVTPGKVHMPAVAMHPTAEEVAETAAMVRAVYGEDMWIPNVEPLVSYALPCAPATATAAGEQDEDLEQFGMPLSFASRKQQNKEQRQQRQRQDAVLAANRSVYVFHPSGQALQEGSQQTDQLLGVLGLSHIWTVPYSPPEMMSVSAAPLPPPQPQQPRQFQQRSHHRQQPGRHGSSWRGGGRPQERFGRGHGNHYYGHSQPLPPPPTVFNAWYPNANYDPNSMTAAGETDLTSKKRDCEAMLSSSTTARVAQDSNEIDLDI